MGSQYHPEYTVCDKPAHLKLHNIIYYLDIIMAISIFTCKSLYSFLYFVAIHSSTAVIDSSTAAIHSSIVVRDSSTVAKDNSNKEPYTHKMHFHEVSLL